MSARLHHFDSQFFPDGAGDDDERQIELLFLQQADGKGDIEIGHHVVAEDKVPLFPVPGFLHRGGVANPFVMDVVTAGFKVADHKPGILLRVFHEQHPKRPALPASFCQRLFDFCGFHISHLNHK